MNTKDAEVQFIWKRQNEKYGAYIQILREELIPAMGVQSRSR